MWNYTAENHNSMSNVDKNSFYQLFFNQVETDRLYKTFDCCHDDRLRLDMFLILFNLFRSL